MIKQNKKNILTGEFDKSNFYDTPKIHLHTQTIEFQLLMNNIMILESKIKV